MTKITLLITKIPQNANGAERMCGLYKKAKERGMDVAIYFLGDGVLCTKKDQKSFIGEQMKAAVEN